MNFVVKLCWKKFYFVVFTASKTFEVILSPKMAWVDFEVPAILKKYALHATQSNMQTSFVDTGSEMRS